jgi:hypothetical protein
MGVDTWANSVFKKRIFSPIKTIFSFFFHTPKHLKFHEPSRIHSTKEEEEVEKKRKKMRKKKKRKKKKLRGRRR